MRQAASQKMIKKIGAKIGRHKLREKRRRRKKKHEECDVRKCGPHAGAPDPAGPANGAQRCTVRGLGPAFAAV